MHDIAKNSSDHCSPYPPTVNHRCSDVVYCNTGTVTITRTTTIQQSHFKSVVNRHISVNVTLRLFSVVSSLQWQKLLDLKIGTREASRFDSNRTSRFDSKVTGLFKNFESLRLPRLPSYHKQHSLFNNKFQSFRHCYWDLYWEFN